MFILNPRPPTSNLFPYTTLFRSPHELREEIESDAPGLEGQERGGAGQHLPPLRARREHQRDEERQAIGVEQGIDRKSTRLNSSHVEISYAVFCLKKKNKYRALRS